MASSDERWAASTEPGAPAYFFVHADSYPVRTGKVLVPPSPDPTTAFRREITMLVEAGHEREAFGLCIGLALLTCEPVEVLWETFMLI